MTATPVINRHTLVLASVTLNGKPAQVTGIRNDFAMVRSLRGEVAPVEFSWQTVERVVMSGGNFKS
jgi:hypothetical protein